MARNDELKLNRIDGTAQDANLSAQMNSRPVVISVSITADATGGLAITVPYDMEIYDVVVQARATVGGGTVQLQNGGNAITDAIVMATDTNITRVGTIDDTYSSIATSTVLTAVTANAGDRGIVKIYGMRS